jgi:hypothetical protein
LNPDVVGAVARLKSDKVLSGEQAVLFDRVARRLLVSVRVEIRALLYAGVLLLTSGVGLLVKEHHGEIGPWAIAVAIGLTGAALVVELRDGDVTLLERVGPHRHRLGVQHDPD